VDGTAIPDDQELARDVPLQMFQEFDHLRAFDGPGIKSEVTSAYFQGNAPPDDGSAFFGDPATVYYLPGTQGNDQGSNGWLAHEYSQRFDSSSLFSLDCAGYSVWG
jgi:hypothetical protein